MSVDADEAQEANGIEYRECKERILAQLVSMAKEERKRFLADLEAMQQGEDPKGIIRDPDANKNVMLPIAARKVLTEGLTREDISAGRDGMTGLSRPDFVWLVGQPDDVKRDYREAMGF